MIHQYADCKATFWKKIITKIITIVKITANFIIIVNRFTIYSLLCVRSCKAPKRGGKLKFNNQ